MSLVVADPPSGFPFMRLPAELRLEIYCLLLTGRTIHMERIVDSRQNTTQRPRKLLMVYNICTASVAMQSLSRLMGASHSQDQMSATSHGTQKPCLGVHAFGGNQCNGTVRIDVQLLRICREIYDEVALLPYAENHFIIPEHESNDVLQLTSDKRHEKMGRRKASFLEKARLTKLNATSRDRHMVAHDVFDLDPTGRARPVYVHLGRRMKVDC